MFIISLVLSLVLCTGFWGYKDPQGFLPGRAEQLMRQFFERYLKDTTVCYGGDEGMILMVFGKNG